MRVEQVLALESLLFFVEECLHRVQVAAEVGRPGLDRRFEARGFGGAVRGLPALGETGARRPAVEVVEGHRPRVQRDAHHRLTVALRDPADGAASTEEESPLVRDLKWVELVAREQHGRVLSPGPQDQGQSMERYVRDVCFNGTHRGMLCKGDDAPYVEVSQPDPPGSQLAASGQRDICAVRHLEPRFCPKVETFRWELDCEARIGFLPESSFSLMRLKYDCSQRNPHTSPHTVLEVSFSSRDVGEPVPGAAAMFG